MVAYRNKDLEASLNYLRAASEIAGENLELLETADGVKEFSSQFSSIFATLARTETAYGSRAEGYKSILESARILKLSIEQWPNNLHLKKNLGLLQINLSYYEEAGTETQTQLNEGIQIFESVVKDFPSDSYSMEVLTYGYNAAIDLMFKMRDSAPEEAISFEEGLAILAKADALVELGLLETDDGCDRYLSLLRRKAKILERMAKNEMARDTALEAADIASKFANSKSATQRNRIPATYQNLAYFELQLGNREGFFEATEKIKKFCGMEQLKSNVSVANRAKQQEHFAWALKHECDELARLGKFNEAIERARQHYDLIFLSGEYKGHNRYRTSAQLVSEVLAMWKQTDANAISTEQYQKGVLTAIRWLEIGVENDVRLTANWIRKSEWDPLRDHERFALIAAGVTND
jgi:tetratricopeptide (TPR) repeat protein